MHVGNVFVLHAPRSTHSSFTTESKSPIHSMAPKQAKKNSKNDAASESDFFWPLESKLEIIKAVTAGTSQSSMAKKFNKSEAAISKLMKNKEVYLAAIAKKVDMSTQQIRTTKLSLLGCALFEWYLAARENPVRVEVFKFKYLARNVLHGRHVLIT